MEAKISTVNKIKGKEDDFDFSPKGLWFLWFG